MPGNSATINAILCTQAPKTAERLGKSTQSQSTGTQNLDKKQVNMAIKMRTNFYIAKTQGAIQNIQITRGFLSTVSQNLETTLEKLNDMSQSVLTLLNGVVPSEDRESAVNSLLEGLGMVSNPTSRDQLEGSIVKSLRQGGAGQSLYFRTQSEVREESFPKLEGEVTVAGKIVELDKEIEKAANDLQSDLNSLAGSGSLTASNALQNAKDLVVKNQIDPFLQETLKLATSVNTTNKAEDLAKAVADFGKTAISATHMGGIQKTLVESLEEVLKNPGNEPFANVQAAVGTVIADLDASLTNLKTAANAPSSPASGATVTSEIALVTAAVNGFITTAKGASGSFTINETALKTAETALKTEQANALQTRPVKEFFVNPDSNYGAGVFSLRYEEGHLKVFDSFDDLVESYPIPAEVFEQAAKEAGTNASGTATISAGKIGVLSVSSDVVDQDGVVNWDKDTAIYFDNKTAGLNVSVTVSGNDGTRSLALDDLTDPTTLWGDNLTLDAQKLQNESAYQQQVKGLIDHASEKIQKSLQAVRNLMSTLENDELAQNVTLENCKNQVETVSGVDPVVIAQEVLANSQEYNRLISALTLLSGINRDVNDQAQRIAQMASR